VPGRPRACERELGGRRRRSVLRRRRQDAEAVVSAYDDARRAYDAKTKPRGSLGRIEDLGSRLAGIRGFIPERLEKAIVVAAADPLTALGGFEIAFLAGVVLACEHRRVAVLLDGFITGAAALAAVRLSPSAVEVMIAAHVSPEPGHALVLEALGLEPLLDLGL